MPDLQRVSLSRSASRRWIYATFPSTRAMLLSASWTSRLHDPNTESVSESRFAVSDIGTPPAPMYQFLLKVGARHPGHRDVEEQTPRFADDVGREECF